MKLMIIRHGDPDYSIDSLTPKGHLEAAALAEYMKDLDVKAFYVSPLGRAQHTARYTLDKMGRTAETLDWLREFPAKIKKLHDPQNSLIAWDWLPNHWAQQDIFYDAAHWSDHPIMAEGNIRELYDRVCGELDKLLAKHGYERNGRTYKAVAPNEDTIVFFCHFGLESVLLSHLLNVSPMVVWHGFCAAPSSVTTIYTEERQAGTASFRISRFGDVSHLYAAGLEPSFSARFCETQATFDSTRD